MGNSTSKHRAPGAATWSGADAKVVRELAKILLDTGLSEIEVERGELRVRVARDSGRESFHAVAAAAVAAPTAARATESTATRSAALAGHPGGVTSPMVGTVYLSSDPKTDPFIKVGQQVAAGDTLVLIEAMKTFNPIPAPKAGKVVEILVQDAQPVEFGELLVVIE
jgi:acetyl-CoA carboxylase biotin carboxyl carrier protein